MLKDMLIGFFTPWRAKRLGDRIVRWFSLIVLVLAVASWFLPSSAADGILDPIAIAVLVASPFAFAYFIFDYLQFRREMEQIAQERTAVNRFLTGEITIEQLPEGVRAHVAKHRNEN